MIRFLPSLPETKKLYVEKHDDEVFFWYYGFQNPMEYFPPIRQEEPAYKAVVDSAAFNWNRRFSSN